MIIIISSNFLFLILNKISTITNIYNGKSRKIKKRSQQQNDIRYYMLKNNKLRTHFMIKKHGCCTLAIVFYCILCISWKKIN